MTPSTQDARATGLVELAVRCEQATGADRELDCAIGLAIGLEYRCDPGQWGWLTPHWSDGSWVGSCPSYTASLDAAMTLVPDGCTVSLSLGRVAIAGVHILSDDPRVEPIDNEATNVAASAALALTAAALRALAASTKDQNDDA